MRTAEVKVEFHTAYDQENRSLWDVALIGTANGKPFNVHGMDSHIETALANAVSALLTIFGIYA